MGSTKQRYNTDCAKDYKDNILCMHLMWMTKLFPFPKDITGAGSN